MFDVVEELLQDRQASSGDDFAVVKEYPTCGPELVAWPEVPLVQPVDRALGTEFPDGLYQHQAAAIAAVKKGENVVVATRTSSGKSLVYVVPIAEAMVESDDATALLFFPTKALANDQFNAINARLRAVMREAGKDLRPHEVARYDGSTEQELRPTIRESVRVLLTNPDMAHRSLLAWHEQHWQRFLKHLRYIILDEAHEYRGTFGTNVALLLHRLLLLCQRYGSRPRFVATSATIEGPANHLQLLTGREFCVIPPDADGSLQGAKRFWVVRPAVHPFATARALLESLVDRGKSVIAFCLSRKSAEENAEHFEDHPGRRIRVYRAGLLPRERHEIEEGLRSGTVKGVFATSALELGIDIGLLDVCICIGLPNTMMSLWQRAGRVGRGGKPGAVILVPEARPLDAYYAEHPHELFERPNEPLAVNMNSRTLAKWHYACGMREAGGDLDLIPPEALGWPMERIAQEYVAGRLDDNIFHTDQPHFEYDIRAGADAVFELQLSGSQRNEKVGEIGRSQMLMEAAPNAIYRHNLQRFRVTRVLERDKVIRLRPERTYNRTNAFTNKKVRVLSCIGSRHNSVMTMEECDRLRVTETLVNLAEKSRDGNPVGNWSGSQGLLPNILPTSGVVLRVRDPVRLMFGLDAETPVARAAQEAWNGLAPLLTGMLPTILGPCDLGDFAIHPQWELRDAKLYMYDKAYDGIDLTLPAFERIEELLAASLQRAQECRCEEPFGCFRCVRHPFEDLATNRRATIHMIRSLVESTEREPLEVTFRKESGQLVEEEESVKCPLCGFRADLGAKFCSNCGRELEQP